MLPQLPPGSLMMLNLRRRIKPRSAVVLRGEAANVASGRTETLLGTAFLGHGDRNVHVYLVPTQRL